jgi:hypothetical protein
MKNKLLTVDLIKRIRNDVIEAGRYFEVYRTYCLPETREKYAEVISQHSVWGAFFDSDSRAHFVAMIATLGRIFDTNEKNICIAALEKVPEFKQGLGEKFERAQQLWNGRKIKVLRHQVVAHHSSRTTVERIIFKIVKLPVDELGELIGLLERLIDDWSRKAKCHSYNLSRSGVKRDLDYLLDTLLRTREERRPRSAATARLPRI